MKQPRMSRPDLRAHAEGGSGVEPMLAAEVLELRALVRDLREIVVSMANGADLSRFARSAMKDAYEVTKR